MFGDSEAQPVSSGAHTTSLDRSDSSFFNFKKRLQGRRKPQSSECECYFFTVALPRDSLRKTQETRGNPRKPQETQGNPARKPRGNPRLATIILIEEK